MTSDGKGEKFQELLRDLGLQKHLIISHQFFSPTLVYCLNVTQIYSLSDARVSNPIQLWEHSFRNGERGMSATSILLNVIFHSLMNHHMREKFKIASACEGEFALALQLVGNR